jgi:hypothetical protein
MLAIKRGVQKMSGDNILRFGDPGQREAFDRLISRLSQRVAAYTLSSAEMLEVRERLWRAWCKVGDYAGRFPIEFVHPEWATGHEAELDRLYKDIAERTLSAYRAAWVRERIEREIEGLRGAASP